MFRREASIFFPRHHALGSRQVVVHELAVGKTAADMTEETEQLLFAERRPAGQRDLKPLHTEVTSSLDAFRDRSEGKIDDANHRLGISPPHFVGKSRDDFFVLTIRDRVAFSCGAKDIEELCPVQSVLYVETKDAFGEATVLIPRDTTGAHDSSWKTFVRHRGARFFQFSVFSVRCSVGSGGGNSWLLW